MNSLADLEQLVTDQPDLVFLGLKYLPVSPVATTGQLNKIWVSSYLEEHGIAHTGSGQKAIEYELDKSLAKQQILDCGLKTSPYIVIRHGEEFTGLDFKLHFPLFLKPTSLGGGMGVDDSSIVNDIDQLRIKAQAIGDKYGADTLVEEYLPGREFSVAILKEKGTEQLLVMPIELVAASNLNGNRILSRAMKVSNQEQVLPVNDPFTRARVIKLASDVFKALGARDYGRIDIRLDQSGEPHFLEANLIPSLISGYGSFPKACEMNEGMDQETMIMQIVRLGLERSSVFNDQVCGLEFSQNMYEVNAAQAA